jgi:hypothetical protein
MPETGKAASSKVSGITSTRVCLRGIRGFKNLIGARVTCRTHAIMSSLRAGCHDRAGTVVVAEPWLGPRVACAWDAQTAILLA